MQGLELVAASTVLTWSTSMKSARCVHSQTCQAVAAVAVAELHHPPAVAPWRVGYPWVHQVLRGVPERSCARSCTVAHARCRVKTTITNKKHLILPNICWNSAELVRHCIL